MPRSSIVCAGAAATHVSNAIQQSRVETANEVCFYVALHCLWLPGCIIITAYGCLLVLLLLLS